ncbi:formylglycine-generating enzyme family protein [Leptospira noguchii]|uniref:Formylglycine-generating sulfatase enzyme n=2 Tax=Leptospira noguchii TaxID=28182 RepID=T0FKW5_9LEPT|nr:SUMF1/EgtB/PvdO family nonheme iron enzyme [Leptospira noguchii]EMO55602.1 formylglycine-generating sulfatase enzyme [Leptospira noguchii]EQA70185.1 formylglycine-generating sulfatase enzyme [Leptospira noguchii serovar Panama str. CZ214]
MIFDFTIKLKRFYFFLLFGSITFLFAQTQDSSLNTRMIPLWKGEVEAVYSGKGKVKIRIRKGSIFYGKEEEEIKAILEKKSQYSVLQKNPEKEIGHFSIRQISVVYQNNSDGKKVSEIELYGSFVAIPGVPESLLTAGTFIQDYKQEIAYIEPGAFFTEDRRRTRPSKQLRHPKDGKEMVLVSGGYEQNGEPFYESMGFFIHGQGNDPSEDSYNPFYFKPERGNLQDVSSFYIDKYEVTNQEYSKFLKETNTPPPPHWKGGNFPTGKEHHPVNGITYREAEIYARWSGKRLPTEMEWEKAARGTGMTWKINRDESYSFFPNPLEYPFGNDFDPTLCNTLESKQTNTISVYELAKKSASPYGAIGMCGNVAEWTSSDYLPYPGHSLKRNAFGKIYKVIRGGSFSSTKEESTTYFRSFGGIPNLKTDRRAGFRLVWDLPGK